MVSLSQKANKKNKFIIFLACKLISISVLPFGYYRDIIKERAYDNELGTHNTHLYRGYFKVLAVSLSKTFQGVCGNLSEQRNAPAFELHIGIAHLTKFPRRLMQKRQNSAPRRPATPSPVHQIRAQRTPVPHIFHILRSTLRQTCIPVTTCVARTSTFVASHICS